jgi:hypothetical protein
MFLRSTLFGLLLLTSVATFAQSNGELYGAEFVDISASIRLYPNPAPEYVYVQLGILKAEKVKLSIHTVIGNESPAEVEKIDDHQVRIRVKDMASGYYFLTIKDDETRFRATYKFLKR